jgi:hypothetical protein
MLNPVTYSDVDVSQIDPTHPLWILHSEVELLAPDDLSGSYYSNEEGDWVALKDASVFTTEEMLADIAVDGVPRGSTWMSVS